MGAAKIMFVATGIVLSQQKMCFVATSVCLLQQNFVARTIMLVAAPANDTIASGRKGGDL